MLRMIPPRLELGEGVELDDGDPLAIVRGEALERAEAGHGAGEVEHLGGEGPVLVHEFRAESRAKDGHDHAAMPSRISFQPPGQPAPSTVVGWTGVSTRRIS